MASQQPAGNVNPQNEDYVDKGLDKIEQALGKKSGHNIDSNKMRSTNEKITDTLRTKFEQLTGKHVSDKVSN